MKNRPASILPTHALAVMQSVSIKGELNASFGFSTLIDYNWQHSDRLFIQINLGFSVQT